MQMVTCASVVFTGDLLMYRTCFSKMSQVTVITVYVTVKGCYQQFDMSCLDFMKFVSDTALLLQPSCEVKSGIIVFRSLDFTHY